MACFTMALLPARCCGIRLQVEHLQVFNPPYVPTPEEEVSRAGIAQAWAGGMHGRVVIDKVLPLVKPLQGGPCASALCAYHSPEPPPS